MVCESRFAALSSCIKNRIGVNIEKVVITPAGIHRDHPMLAFLGGYDFAAVFQDKRIWLKISQCTQTETSITGLKLVNFRLTERSTLKTSNPQDREL